MTHSYVFGIRTAVWLARDHLEDRRVEGITKQIYGPRYLSRYSDSLRSVRFGDRIRVEATFSAPVQTGPGTHPASYTKGTG